MSKLIEIFIAYHHKSENMSEPKNLLLLITK